ncbi:hypothetical protein D9619_003901 [Psilocybe cf. subviscida]|uniref:Uncharacterized protein n=1 Tax=Psilocybe cf. subviscida TaxID=2480587 RepID=A0A8H5BT80_9AGAR|nr:hypothetical protein D9619_003901 [Psilocybe cf. subviscida]
MFRDKISFTFNAWTSNPGGPYLSITGHYIDTPSDDPLAWKLKEEQLVFEPIEGNHSGANMAKVIVRVIDQYCLRSNVGWFTADNAPNNDTAIKAVAEDLDPSGLN